MRIIENIKSLVLTILILLSLVLTGSLWFENYQGLSFVIANLPEHLLGGFSELTEQEYSKRYEELITPYKVTVASGEEGRWIFYQSDVICHEAWELIKNKLNIVDETTEVITGDMSEWKDLVNRKTLIVEFGGTINFDILKIVVGSLKSDKQDVFNNIEKIAITKSIDGGVMYVCKKSDGKTILNKVLLKDNIEELETILQKSISGRASSKFVTILETGTNKFYGNKTVEPSDDVLLPISNKQDKRDKVYKITGNIYFKSTDLYTENKFVTSIFRNSDFARFVTNNNGSIYINDDKSSIRIEENGLVVYENNGKISEETTSSSTDFNAAIDFINRINVYENIFLLKTSKENNVYTFNFGTSINGIPIAFHDRMIGEDERTIVEIRVKNGVVISFTGKVMTFATSNESLYITNFAHNILDNILAEMEENETMKLENVRLIYDASSEGTYYPNWLISYKVGNEKGESIIKATRK